MNLKKSIIFATLCSILAIGAFAQEKTTGHTRADITYQTAPIYKVLDSTDNYVVLYGKYGAKIGTVNIPKKWAKWHKDTPRKLTVRKLPSKIAPFITIVKKNNEFLKVMITVPTDKNNPLWGIAPAKKTDSTEPESIELELY